MDEIYIEAFWQALGVIVAAGIFLKIIEFILSNNEEVNHYKFWIVVIAIFAVECIAGIALLGASSFLQAIIYSAAATAVICGGLCLIWLFFVGNHTDNDDVNDFDFREVNDGESS